MSSLLAATSEFVRPPIDWHAAAPELTLLAFGALITMVDIGWLERGRKTTSVLASFALLATMIPIITLAADGTDREMFNGAFVVDNYALIMKAMFVLAGYVVVLLSTNYIAEGDYWENEYYGLLLSSILGMVLMASARDLITIFVALELLSIPAYMLATWRKRDLKSNEAGMKYYLMGVFASAVMLYGMSLLYGEAGSTLLATVNEQLSAASDPSAVMVLGVIFVVVGFAFKVSAFPFHTWAPDTYEGAPTPVTAFLSVASKAAGFVALMNIVFVGLLGRDDVVEPLMWVLAAGSMTVGNLIALRQTNIVRMLAYSGVAQAGYMLAPLAVYGDVPDTALGAVVTYLVIYAAMNLGAFAVVMAVARKTRSAEIADYRGLFHYAPGLTVAMTIFLFALAGIPPLGGWFAKFRVIEALIDANNASGVVLGIVVAVNSVIALYYYARIGLGMWAEETPDGDLSRVDVPVSLVAAIGITAIVTIAFGLGLVVGDFTDVSLVAAAAAERAMSAAASLADRLDQQIAADGPLPVSTYVEAALYDPDAGFYGAGGGRAGRRGDFLTAPEVGPLFGAVLARAVDAWWERAGRPATFVVEDWGAGPGTLARAIVAAEPAVLAAGALTWIQVEQSAEQRAAHLAHPRLRSAAPAEVDGAVDLIVANELLDNLAFDIVERAADDWRQVRVAARDAAGRFGLALGDAVASSGVLTGLDVPAGTRVPTVAAAADWVARARDRADRVVVLDYGATTAELATRDGAWLRTHVAHEGEADWRRDPGSCDITIDVPLDQLPPPSQATTQAEFLRAHGIEELVEEGRQIWEASASIGDLAALKARSRVREAEALLEPAGMGGFHVLEWTDD